MPITLESRVRRMQVLNLPHEAFCRDRCACTETTVVVVAENPRTGDRAPKRVSKKLPTSMTWLALERRAGLSRVLLEVPDVKAAIAQGHLRLVEQAPDPVPAPTATTMFAPTAGAPAAPARGTPPPSNAVPTAKGT
jgi:hypothetical protein